MKTRRKNKRPRKHGRKTRSKKQKGGMNDMTKDEWNDSISTPDIGSSGSDTDTYDSESSGSDTDTYDSDDNYYIENPNIINKYTGKTLLMKAIEEEKNKKFIEQMIENDANLEICDKMFKKTALIYAIEKENYKIVKLLLEKGANPNIKYSFSNFLSPSSKKNVPILNRNALHEAIEMQDNKIIELLLEYVDLTQLDNNYDSFVYAIENKNYKLIKLLLEKGGDLNKPDEYGNLIISKVLDKYNWDDDKFSIFKLLIENGMNINVDFDVGTDNKQTPLTHVIYNFEQFFDMKVIDYILNLKELDINYSINITIAAYPITVLDEVQSEINIIDEESYNYHDYKEIESKLLFKGAKTGKELFSNQHKLIKNNYDLIKSIEYPDGYEGYINLSIITIPKGTILFRKSKDINSDYCGIPNKKANYYTTHADLNVFFYLYPYYSDIIDATLDDKNMTNKMFYLTKDIQLLNLTYPSKANRGDKNNMYYEDVFKSCNTIHQTLTAYDPCLNSQFIEDYPDVMGMLAIAETDAHDHIKLYYNKKKSKKDESLYYSVLWQDSKIRGSPEVILHPFQKRTEQSLFSRGSIIPSKLEDCKKLPKNYELLEESTENSIVSILNEYLRPEGKNNKHITIFSPLKLFVLYEELDDKYKKSCVPLIMDIKSKLQTFQTTDLHKDDMVPFYKVGINPDTNRTFNETIFKTRFKKQNGGKKGRKTRKKHRKKK